MFGFGKKIPSEPVSHISSDDPYDLKRFIDAQKLSYKRVVKELERGKKKSHWMWFIFPRIIGDDMSVTSEHYALGSYYETKAYLGHSILGARLRECSQILIDSKQDRPIDIFGTIDSEKLYESMTLFYLVSEEDIFKEVLDKYFSGTINARTRQALADEVSDLIPDGPAL